MNKRWTEQKYVIHFLLSVMVLGVCAGVSYGLACCQTKGPRDKEAGLVKAVGEVDGRYAAYRASEQRVIEIGLLACVEDGVGDIAAGDMQDQDAAYAEGAPLSTERPIEEGFAGEGQPARADTYAGTAQGEQILPAGSENAENMPAQTAGNTQSAQEGGAAANVSVSEENAQNTDTAQEGGAAENAGNAAGGDTTDTDTVQEGGDAENAETVGSTPVQEDADTETVGQAVAVSAEDYEALLRIVQAEAGNEDTKGKILVANVVLNRVADARFPDTVYEVVFQQSGGRAQFSPVASGSYYKVVVSDDTRQAVDRALAGEDYSEGALFFAARRYAGSSQMRWFDECLTKLFSYGGHEFFTR